MPKINYTDFNILDDSSTPLNAPQANLFEAPGDGNLPGRTGKLYFSGTFDLDPDAPAQLNFELLVQNANKFQVVLPAQGAGDIAGTQVNNATIRYTNVAVTPGTAVKLPFQLLYQQQPAISAALQIKASDPANAAYYAKEMPAITIV